MNSWLEKLHDTFIVDNNYELLIEGFGNTMLITVCALLIGVVIGAAIAIAKYFAEGNKKLRIVNWVCDIYTTVIRGVPVTVLLMIFYFVIIVSDTDGITTAIIAFGINSGAYMAELIRSDGGSKKPWPLQGSGNDQDYISAGNQEYSSRHW